MRSADRSTGHSPAAGRRRLTGCALGIVGVAIVVSGCSTAPPAEAGVTTLTFTAQAGLKTVLPGILERWDAEHPDIRIVPTYVSDVIPIERIQLQGGQATDLITVFPGNGSPVAVEQLAPGDFLADLSEQSWVGQVSESARDAMSSDGRALMFSPFSVAVGTFYNKQVFAEHGMEIPTTWSGLLESCDAFNAAGIIPLALGGQTADVVQLIDYALVPSLVYGPDPDFAEQQADGTASFADSGWREALTKYQELAERGCFQKGFNGTTGEQATTLVGTGKAAMSVLVSASAPDLAKHAPLDDFAMFPLPATDDPDDTWGAVALGAGVGANAAGEHVEEAKAFIEFLSEPANIAAFSKDPGRIPVIQSEDVAVDPVTGTAYNPLIADDRTTGFPDQGWPSPLVQSTHMAKVQELLEGRTTVSDVLAAMDKAYRG